MKICIVTPGYPSKGVPFFVFVERLVNEFADQGLECVVLCPQSITNIALRGNKIRPYKSTYKTEKGNQVTIMRPYYISFSNWKIGQSIALFTSRLALKRCVDNLKELPTIFYAHFWESAYQVFEIAKQNDVPLVVSTGESEIKSLDFISNSLKLIFKNYISAVICVSNKNKLESIKKGLTSEEKCIVLSNAIDSSKFFKKNKLISRLKMGFSNDDFIIIFVGGFIERKGSLRVSKAIDILNDENIKSIFIGKGDGIPNCKGILHCGPLENTLITDYLNCADVFVLPTQKEGCCNAIIEAMACGLPIISSNLSFNDEILNEYNSIRIDPNNIEQLSEAIRVLKNSQNKRDSMSFESLKIAANLTIDIRASKIIEVFYRSL